MTNNMVEIEAETAELETMVDHFVRIYGILRRNHTGSVLKNEMSTEPS